MLILNKDKFIAQDKRMIYWENSCTCATQGFFENTYKSLFPSRSSLVDSEKDCGLNSYTVSLISSKVDDPAYGT